MRRIPYHSGGRIGSAVFRGEKAAELNNILKEEEEKETRRVKEKAQEMEDQYR